MKPLRTALLVLFILLSLGALGASLSDVWNSRKQLRESRRKLAPPPVETAATDSPVSVDEDGPQP